MYVIRFYAYLMAVIGAIQYAQAGQKGNVFV